MHMHSNYSDGDCSVEELVRRIKKVGLRAAVLTDHDRTEGLKEFIKLCGSIDTITGVEISANASEINTGVHILGYGFNPSLFERNCREILRYNVALRQKNIKKTINLYQQKLMINFCFEDFKAPPFSLPAEIQSIYWVIKHRAKCLQALMKQSGRVFGFREAYKIAKEEVSRSGVCYSPSVGKYVEAGAVIRGIKASMGIAVWAHPVK